MKQTSRLALIFCAAVLLTACTSSGEKRSIQQKKDTLVATNVKLGVEYMQRGQLEYAKEQFDKALKVDSNNAQANNAMALLLWRFKEYDKAEHHFSRAVSIDPNNPDAQNNFGVFLCQQRKISAAVKHFNKALENPLYTTPAQANLNAGLCLIKVPEMKAEAEHYFRQALKHDPKLTGALYQMAEISFRQGKLLSARGFIERFFAVSEDTAESLYIATRIEQSLNVRDAAASYRIRLKGKFPDSPEAKKIGR